MKNMRGHVDYTPPSNMTIRLLRVIGSPFAQRHEIPKNEEIPLLYNHAVKNKVGFLYLDAIKELGVLNEFEETRNSLLHRYHTFLISMGKVSELLSENELQHVIFKSTMPFQVILSDIDVLLMDMHAEDNLKNVLEIMRKNDFECIEDLTPLKIQLHDLREGTRHVMGTNDPYDIDIYSEIRANRFIYLDKLKLERWTRKTRLLNAELPVFAQCADLIIQIVHSFYEHLYTLLHYYSIIHYLSTATDSHEILRIAKKNRTVGCLKIALLITGLLHNAAHGNIPYCLKKLLIRLGINMEQLESRTITLETPYRYSMSMLARVIVEKICEPKARRSFVLQIAKISNPKVADHLIRQILSRRQREYY